MASSEENIPEDILELCLDICSPTTLAALICDHKNYIAQHQASTAEELWGHMDIIQQDQDLLHAHLTDVHFAGDTHRAQAFLEKYEPTHIPF